MNANSMNPDRKIRLLLVEDEQAFAWVLADTLSTSGFEVRTAADGAEALAQVEAFVPDVVVTDIMMPHMDGFSFVRQMRKAGDRTPVVFLSARTDAEDVVKGFELGAGDYVRKPFAIKELIVRIRALLGRAGGQGKAVGDEEEQVFRLGRFTFDALTHKLRLSSGSGDDHAEAVSLPTRESEILAMLCRQMGRVVPNAAILGQLWGNDDYFCTRSLNVHVTRLRKKLAADPSIRIEAFRGTGYRLLVEADADEHGL